MSEQNYYSTKRGRVMMNFIHDAVGDLCFLKNYAKQVKSKLNPNIENYDDLIDKMNKIITKCDNVNNEIDECFKQMKQLEFETEE